MEKKTVSVVMCTYNGEKYLREQMDSILAQTYPIHEIIVCDDCSTDGTMNILQEYATKFPFIKVHRNTRNKGCNQNFHDIFYQVSKKVDYIAISDQDDIWFPEKIGKLVQLNRKGRRIQPVLLRHHLFPNLLSSANQRLPPIALYRRVPVF